MTTFVNRTAAWISRAAPFFGILLIAVIVGGCSGGGKSSNASLGAGSGGDRAAAVPAPNHGEAQDAANSTPPLQQRDIIRTATVKLRTRNVDDAANSIVALAEPAGGRVDGDDRSSEGRARTATLVLRVPPDALNRIIGRVDDLGTETGRSVHGEDVTAKKADVTARTAALQTSVDRLRNLMSHSASVNSLVSLENQLTQRESELESMQAQQRGLVDEIALATLRVELSSVPKHAAKPETKAAGLGSAFTSGWHALLAALRWFVRIIGYSLPITAVLLLIGGGSLFLWRRHQSA
ncbi:MAG TPA: DUF4349 domain-containing protein [Mycobacteriales bacterium]|nr:DUF4349 domain-containing protein [Mycobacteriales bacterium]